MQRKDIGNRKFSGNLENEVQIVIGGAGSGKSTYTLEMSDLLKQLDQKLCLINLDCGNGQPPYPPDIDIRDLVNIESISSEHDLGPNGSLIFSMEQLMVDFAWLQDRIMKTGKDTYFLTSLVRSSFSPTSGSFLTW